MTDLPESTIDRHDLLPHLFPDPGAYLLIAGLAGAAKDTAAWTQEADNLIALGGAMGGQSRWRLAWRWRRRNAGLRLLPVMAN